MFPCLCILGRQPALGLAELESLFGANAVKPVGEQAALLDMPHKDVPFARLGGTIKFCKVLTELETTHWGEIQKFLEATVPEHVARLPAGKMRIGLSVYGLSVSPKQITGTGLALKKVIRAHDRSARIVPNNEAALNSAQVLHNQLTGPLGWELIFVRDNSKTIVAQSIAVQDITAYAARDQARPKRDARVGMLPPKLAQIIINLAVNASFVASHLSPVCGQETGDKKQETTKSPVLLDPFCGTGVILQEALLMGYGIYGSDIEPRMVEYSRDNLDWLSSKYTRAAYFADTEVGDATNHTWSKKFDTVASEVYLGQPFSVPPTADKLAENVQTANIITKKFLQNLATQTKPGFRACIATPAWKTSSGFKQLPAIDRLTDMGYNRVSFVHANDSELIYHRQGQIVGRELVVLTRI